MYLIPLDNWPWSTNNRTYKFYGVSFLGNIPLKISCGYFRRALNGIKDKDIVKKSKFVVNSNENFGNISYLIFDVTST